MNLWQLFPESLFNIQGILNLPYLTTIFYLFLLVLLVKYRACRTQFFTFLVTSLAVDIVIVTRIGPGMGTIIIPLLLIGLIALPVAWLIAALHRRNRPQLALFAFITITALSHALSWFFWIIALARS